MTSAPTFRCPACSHSRPVAGSRIVRNGSRICGACGDAGRTPQQDSTRGINRDSSAGDGVAGDTAAHGGPATSMRVSAPLRHGPARRHSGAEAHQWSGRAAQAETFHVVGQDAREASLAQCRELVERYGLTDAELCGAPAESITGEAA